MNIILRESIEDYENEVRQRVERCLGKDNQRNVYIYGYGMMGKFVYQQLKYQMNIAGYIDSDKAKQSKETQDKIKVYDLTDINDNSSIIIASLVGWSSILHKCKSMGYEYCCHYEELAFYDHRLLHWNPAFEGMANSIWSQWKRYDQIYHRLSDDKSKQVFENILAFRLTLNILYTERAYAISTQNNEKIYFDSSIVKTDAKEVFVDCGGYCGETTKDFIRFVSGNYRKIYLFEPDDNLVQKIERELQNVDDVKIFPYGVGKEESIQSFNAVGDASGNFSIDGMQKVKVVRISDVICEKVSYIKMDIEGMEAEALQGAHEIIQRDKPKLAISVYHKCDDMFALANQILRYRKDYQLYIRHYSPNCDDTVMYFV